MTPRQTARRWVVAALLLAVLWPVPRTQAQFASENAAMGVLDAFMTAFNARDDAAMWGTALGVDAQGGARGPAR